MSLDQPFYLLHAIRNPLPVGDSQQGPCELEYPPHGGPSFTATALAAAMGRGIQKMRYSCCHLMKRPGRPYNAGSAAAAVAKQQFQP